MSIVTEKIDNGKLKMNFFRFGKGPETLAIIPGMSVQSVMPAADQIAAAYSSFTEDFTVYVFDRRLDMPPVYSVKDMAEDTAQVFMELGLSDVYIFGASQGGMIALEIATEHPELIKKIAVGSTSSNLRNYSSALFDEWIQMAENRDVRGLYLSFGEKLYPRAVFEKFKDTLIASADTVTDEELRRFIICSKGMKGFDISGQLDKIECPILVIGVYEDEVLDSDMTMEMAEHLDAKEDFELYLYKGFGHAAYDTAPDYVERLYRFYMK